MFPPCVLVADSLPPKLGYVEASFLLVAKTIMFSTNCEQRADALSKHPVRNWELGRKSPSWTTKLHKSAKRYEIHDSIPAVIARFQDFPMATRTEGEVSDRDDGS